METPPPQGFYFFLAVFWLVVAGTILMVLWKVAAWWGERAMSREGEWEAPEKEPVPPAVATFTTARQPIVTPNNEYSSGLSDSGRRAFETKAETIAILYEAGIVTNLSKAICKAYGCSVQAATKTDSTYQMALKAVNRHLPKKDTGPQYHMTPEQEAAREALGLSKP